MWSKENIIFNISFFSFHSIKVYVPTDEMYDLTEQAYAYSSTLYDIYGASDQFEKKADSFFKVRDFFWKWEIFNRTVIARVKQLSRDWFVFKKAFV